MGYKLCVTEKKSVAEDIAKVIGIKIETDRKGYFEGNGYRVTWAMGHLIRLYEPEEYDEKYKDRCNIDLLPICPELWKTKVIDDPHKKRQFGIIKNLMNDPECDLVIDCGDMGSQGHYLQWLIRKQACCKKPVMRFTATSLTKESIKSHMDNLVSIKNFEKIVEGAFCMAKTNWIYGMSFSRLYSTLYKSSVREGLVKSPTLYMVTQRYIENKKFNPEIYYQIRLKLKFNEIEFSALMTDNNGRIKEQQKAVEIIKSLDEMKYAIAKTIEKTDEITQRPGLYDITELEKDGDSRYGYTPAEVLAAAQSLYEKHLTTYPRTDSCYITHDLAPHMEHRIMMIGMVDSLKDAAEEVLRQGLNIDKFVCDDSKVSDHHAIITTEEFNENLLDKLTQIERNVLKLIIERMLIAFSYPYKYKKTKLIMTTGGRAFACFGNQPVDYGYKEILEKLGYEKSKSNTEDDETLPKMDEGDKAKIVQLLKEKKKTTAPQLYTYRSILNAMKNAGNNIEDGEFKKALNNHKGIGTQATRAQILEELVKIGYIEEVTEKKKKFLVPSEKGMAIVQITDPELLSPEVSARCEYNVKLIESGQMSSDEFMKDVMKNVNECMARAKHAVTEQNMEIMTKFKHQNLKEKDAGQCPYCGGKIIEGKTSFFCEKWKPENKGCNFIITKTNIYFYKRTNKELTSNDIKKLVSKNGLLLKCTSSAGNEYRLRVYCKTQPEETSNGRKFVAFESEFANNTSVKGKR